MHDTKVFIGNSAEQQCHTTWNDICYSNHLVIWLWERVQQSRMGTHGTFQLPTICALIHCYFKKYPKAAFCCFSYHLYLQSPSVCPWGATASPLTCGNAAWRFVPAKLIEFPPCGLTHHFSAESAGNKTNQRQKHYPLWKYNPSHPPPRASLRRGARRKGQRLWATWEVAEAAACDRGSDTYQRDTSTQVTLISSLPLSWNPARPWNCGSCLKKKKERGHYSCY